MNERQAKGTLAQKERPVKNPKNNKSGPKKTNGNGKQRSMAQMRKSLVTKSTRKSDCATIREYDDNDCVFTGRPPMIAVHYVGHIDPNDRYHQRHGNGNAHVQHHGGVYADWKPANWSSVHGMERFFRTEHGVVTVQEAGLYHVYAQVGFINQYMFTAEVL